MELTDHNGITEAGQAAIDHIEGLIESAGRSVTKLNALPGYAKHYLANVQKMKALSPQQWLEDYRYSGAQVAYEEAAKFIEAVEPADENNALVEQLQALADELKAVREELAVLKEGTAPKSEEPATATEEETEAE